MNVFGKPQKSSLFFSWTAHLGLPPPGLTGQKNKKKRGNPHFATPHPHSTMLKVLLVQLMKSTNYGFDAVICMQNSKTLLLQDKYYHSRKSQIELLVVFRKNNISSRGSSSIIYFFHAQILLSLIVILYTALHNHNRTVFEEMTSWTA